MDQKTKAKVVASVCWAECVKFLARWLFCLSLFGRKGSIQPFLLNRPRQNSKHGKKLNKFCPPQTEATTFALSSVFILLLWCLGFRPAPTTMVTSSSRLGMRTCSSLSSQMQPRMRTPQEQIETDHPYCTLGLGWLRKFSFSCFRENFAKVSITCFAKFSSVQQNFRETRI